MLSLINIIEETIVDQNIVACARLKMTLPKASWSALTIMLEDLRETPGECLVGSGTKERTKLTLTQS